MESQLGLVISKYSIQIEPSGKFITEYYVHSELFLFSFYYEHLGSENCYVNTYRDTPQTYKNTIIQTTKNRDSYFHAMTLRALHWNKKWLFFLISQKYTKIYI